MRLKKPMKPAPIARNRFTTKPIGLVRMSPMARAALARICTTSSGGTLKIRRMDWKNSQAAPAMSPSTKMRRRIRKAVSPSIEAVNDGSYQPLSRPLFIYVRDTAAQRAEVKEFIQFYLTQGADLAKEVGYVPLPSEAYKIALRHFADGKMGTVFGGVPEVGVTIDNLLAREGKL